MVFIHNKDNVCIVFGRNISIDNTDNQHPDIKITKVKERKQDGKEPTDSFTEKSLDESEVEAEGPYQKERKSCDF